MTVDIGTPEDVEVLPEGSPIDDLLDKSDADFAKSIGLKPVEGEEVEPTEEEQAQKAEDDEPKQERKIPRTRQEALMEKMAMKDDPIEQQVGDETDFPPRDEKGRFVKKEEAEAEEEPAEQVEAAEGEAAEKATAEGEEAVEQEEEQPKLLTEFEVYKGEEKQEVPRDMTFNFKANKKEYKDVPLDKVVLLAQMGVYNQERQEEVEASKYYVSEVNQQNKALMSAIEELKGEFDALLADEEYREAAVVEYARINTPEHKAAREREELQRQQGELKRQREEQAAANYISTEIMPAVDSIFKTYPTVTEDEVLGRFNRLVAPHLENGRVPVENLSLVKQLVVTDLQEWAKALNLERGVAEQKQQQKVEKQVSAEKQKTAIAKRQVARAVKPKGEAAKPVKKPRKYRSAEEWADSALDDILEGMGG